MQRSRRIAGMWGLLLAGLVAADARTQSAPRGVDPRADAALRRMSSYVGQLPAFSVNTRHSTEVVQFDGQKQSFSGQSEVSVRRPSALRSERKDGEAAEVLYYDGRTLTLENPKTGMYAQAAAPPTIDGMIDFARDRLGLEAPAADLLYRDPYHDLMTDVESGRYVGKETLNGQSVDHVAFVGREVDWQLWIKDGPEPVPLKYQITSKTVRGAPTFTISMSDWNVRPRFAPNTFMFTPRPGATRIEFQGLARPPAGEGSVR